MPNSSVSIVPYVAACVLFFLNMFFTSSCKECVYIASAFLPNCRTFGSWITIMILANGSGASPAVGADAEGLGMGSMMSRYV